MGLERSSGVDPRSKPAPINERADVGRQPGGESINALRGGDRRAFDAIYAAYRPRVHSFLLRLCGDAALAADLSQETWLRLATHAPRLAPETQLKSWLFTVAHNVYRSHRRWSWLNGTRLGELAVAALARPTQTETPFDTLSADESQRRLERALAALPDKYREALLLVAVERLSPSEAAVVLDITAENLRQRLSRARALLSESLAQEKSP